MASRFGGKHFILDLPPVRFETLEGPAHGLEDGFGAGGIPAARRQLLNDLALPFQAVARSGKAPIGHLEVAVRESHGYQPRIGEISPNTKGTANASTTATTRAADTKRSNR